MYELGTRINPHRRAIPAAIHRVSTDKGLVDFLHQTDQAQQTPLWARQYLQHEGFQVSDLETLLSASVELMKLRNENKLLRAMLTASQQRLEAYRGRGNNDRCLVARAGDGSTLATAHAIESGITGDSR